MPQAAAASEALIARNSAITISEWAAEFIASEKLEIPVDRALRLIAELFTVSDGTIVEKNEDPEYPDEWISISIIATGAAGRIADAYDDYVQRWVAGTPAELTRKVRLQIGAA